LDYAVTLVQLHLSQGNDAWTNGLACSFIKAIINPILAKNVEDFWIQHPEFFAKLLN
jgi:hypothetical protein